MNVSFHVFIFPSAFQVLDVVTEVFNSGGSKELTIPFPPSSALPDPLLPQSVSLSDRVKISKERALVRQENAAMFSLWCDTLYKLSIAHEACILNVSSAI